VKGGPLVKPSGRAILGIDAQVFSTIGAVGRTKSALIPGYALDINAKVSPAIGAVGRTKKCVNIGQATHQNKVRCGASRLGPAA